MRNIYKVDDFIKIVDTVWKNDRDTIDEDTILDLTDDEYVINVTVPMSIVQIEGNYANIEFPDLCEGCKLINNCYVHEILEKLRKDGDIILLPVMCRKYEE